MLGSLSGRSHHVFSGVALIYPTKGQSDSEPSMTIFSESTEVTFANLTAGMIDGYVATGEPMDKAGSYGIQAMGGSFVTGIKGCYYNVMGFPMHRFAAEYLKLVEHNVV